MWHTGDKKMGRFRCRQLFPRKNSWFEKSKLTLEQALSFMSDDFYDTARREAFDEEDGSYLFQETIADWYQCCKETVVANFITLQDQIGQIGSQERIVHIESHLMA
ncbi:hypothetical protein Trydic_g1970 [Trypoxylus dichotomus]